MLIPLFFIGWEALSNKIRLSYPEELVYADKLVLVRKTLETFQGRLEAWKGALGSKGLRINVTKYSRED